MGNDQSVCKALHMSWPLFAGMRGHCKKNCLNECNLLYVTTWPTTLVTLILQNSWHIDINVYDDINDNKSLDRPLLLRKEIIRWYFGINRNALPSVTKNNNETLINISPIRHTGKPNINNAKSLVKDKWLYLLTRLESQRINSATPQAYHGIP